MSSMAKVEKINTNLKMLGIVGGVEKWWFPSSNVPLVAASLTMVVAIGEEGHRRRHSYRRKGRDKAREGYFRN